MIIKDCGTVFTQIREHLGKTKAELADELELGKHGERLIERIEQNKEGIQPANLRKLLDLFLGDSADAYAVGYKLLLSIYSIHRQAIDLLTKDQVTNNAIIQEFKAKHKKRLRILYTIFIASVALTIVNTVVFFT
tara:strand:- start:6091 stop:6495 length:405 start_codon:yes stop_codon:yes gene_type:complete